MKKYNVILKHRGSVHPEDSILWWQVTTKTKREAIAEAEKCLREIRLRKIKQSVIDSLPDGLKWWFDDKENMTVMIQAA